MDKKEIALFMKDMFCGTLIEAWKYLKILLAVAVLIGSLTALIIGDIWLKAIVVGSIFLGICIISAYDRAEKRRNRRIKYRKEREECLQDIEEYKEKLAALENSVNLDAVDAQDIPFYKHRIKALESDIADYDKLIKDNGG